MPRRIYYGYWLVVASFLAQFVSLGIFSYVLSSFMTPMIDELGWTRAEFTLSRSIGQVAMAVTGFFIGVAVDRYGGKPLMLVGTTILSVSLGLHSQVTELWQWIVLNGLALTIGCALLGNLVVNVTLAKWFVEKRGQAIAWATMGVSMGGIVITPLVTYLIDTIDWRTTWLLLAVGTAIVMYPVALVMRRAPEDHGLHPDGKTADDVAQGRALKAAEDYARSLTRRQALRTGSFYALVLAFGLFSINIVVMLLQTVPYLTDAGFTRTQAALAITAASVPAMIAKPIWGYFIDHMPAQPLASLSAAFTGLSLFGIVAAVDGGSLVWIYAGYFLLGIGWGGMMPMQEVIWGSFFGRRYLGAVRSAGLPFALALGASAPLLVSHYHDVTASYQGALAVVAGLNVMSGVLILWVPAPNKDAILAGTQSATTSRDIHSS
ncbi:MAG: MFS transporter [Gammaproteobacteria bacterium]|nr:MFS transporter [Gammaproteobacteria bacterium]